MDLYRGRTASRRNWAAGTGLGLARSPDPWRGGPRHLWIIVQLFLFSQMGYWTWLPSSYSIPPLWIHHKRFVKEFPSSNPFNFHIFFTSLSKNPYKKILNVVFGRGILRDWSIFWEDLKSPIIKYIIWILIQCILQIQGYFIGYSFCSKLRHFKSHQNRWNYEIPPSIHLHRFISFARFCSEKPSSSSHLVSMFVRLVLVASPSCGVRSATTARVSPTESNLQFRFEP